MLKRWGGAIGSIRFCDIFCYWVQPTDAENLMSGDAGEVMSATSSPRPNRDYVVWRIANANTITDFAEEPKLVLQLACIVFCRKILHSRHVKLCK